MKRFTLASTNVNSNGETVYNYTSGEQQISFSMDPKTAWSFNIEKMVNATKKEAIKLIDVWVEEAIGEPKTLKNRVKSLKIIA